jgi:hypothetical protein
LSVARANGSVEDLLVFTAPLGFRATQIAQYKCCQSGRHSNREETMQSVTSFTKQFPKRILLAAAICLTATAAIGCKSGGGSSATGNPWFDVARQGGGPAALSAASASGADVNARDRHNRTPLHYAAYERNNAALKALLSKGAELDPVDRDGKTPLYMACDRANAAGALDLINAGADPNLADRRGRTPLWIAAYMGQSQSVKAMLAKGGDPSIPDTRSGRDAADTAMDRGYSEVAEMLYTVRNAKQGIPAPTPVPVPAPKPIPAPAVTPLPSAAPVAPSAPAAPPAPQNPLGPTTRPL